MLYESSTKTLNLTPPGAAVNNASVSVASADCLGFDYAVFRIVLGSTDAGFTALKLQEADDNATWTTVPGLDYSVSPAILPASTDGTHIFAFDVNLTARKRYLKPVITVGAGTTGAYVAVLAELGRAAQAPTTPTARGLTATLVA